MAGKARDAEDITRDPGEIRHPVQRDAKGAAPGKVDFRACKLGEDFQHRLADKGGDVGEAVAITFAAAEEQPVVFGKAEVVDDEFGIRDGVVTAHDLFLRIGAQRFGCDDEIVDRHDAGGGAAVQRSQIAVAGEKDMGRADAGGIGADRGRAAGREVAHL